MGRSLTVEELAQHKGLPAKYLREWVGLFDEPGRGVGIPYWSEVETAKPVIKWRTALRAKDGSFWDKRYPVMAYGEWRLEDARKAGRLLLLEGESDAWAGWLAGYPCLGIPSANSAAILRPIHLEGVKVLFVAREPDQAGARFVQGVLDRLFDLKFRGEPRELRMPDGVKDVCDLYKSAGARDFPAALALALSDAGRLMLAPDAMSDSELFRLFVALRRRPEAAAALLEILRAASKEGKREPSRRIPG